ncbi:G-protein coupled receptor Mth2-like [Neocloeon triangulifer]|uniref:G-protein coupled receptor Mth2-like n=1 Tax=Neocloeon triangulifer TaxID=2078957 RepID=UPI00286F2CAA|nr:G-protein coupled receptor Mth2-like [Neocloeon triangulifer]
MVMSIISLFLTLLAFILTPEMKTLHGKSVACESFTLMMAFVGLTVTHLSGTDSAIIVCKIFAYIGFTFLLSSFFWLNTMCFDIFWTFGNFATMTGSLQQTHEKKFRMYALYSTLYPLINLVIVVIFDFTLTEDSFLWPGIGHGKCWFRSHTLDFLYYQGPAMILLVLNITFFFITLIKINKMKSEARILKKGESMTHGGNGGCAWDDKQRFALYVKMFLLMGGLWIMETISWAAESKPKWLWVPFDIFNSSRGVFIFLFCVACNLKVRNSLMSRFKPQNVHPERPEISCTAQKRSCQINKTSEVSITCGETLATKPLHNNHNFKWAETSV